MRVIQSMEGVVPWYLMDLKLTNRKTLSKVGEKKDHENRRCHLAEVRTNIFASDFSLSRGSSTIDVFARRTTEHVGSFVGQAVEQYKRTDKQTARERKNTKTKGLCQRNDALPCLIRTYAYVYRCNASVMYLRTTPTCQ